MASPVLARAFILAKPRTLNAVPRIPSASGSTSESGTNSTTMRRGKVAARPEWEAMVKATERNLGREWQEIILRHGDWARGGVLAVATRHLGWRLGEVVEREPGVSYAAAAQGIRRFWKRAPNNPEMQAFVAALLD